MKAEKQAKEQGIQNPLFQKGFKETDEERDLATELQRGIVDGPVRAVKGVLEFVTAGVDKGLDTNFTNKLDSIYASYKAIFADTSETDTSETE